MNAIELARSLGATHIDEYRLDNKYCFALRMSGNILQAVTIVTADNKATALTKWQRVCEHTMPETAVEL